MKPPAVTRARRRPAAAGASGPTAGVASRRQYLGVSWPRRHHDSNAPTGPPDDFVCRVLECSSSPCSRQRQPRWLPLPVATACSLLHTRQVLLLEGTMAADKESGRSVFFVPGICSRYTICPRQQAHVFLPVLPSPLLVRIRGRMEEVAITHPRQAGGGSAAGRGLSDRWSWVTFPHSTFWPGRPLSAFWTPLSRWLGRCREICPSQQVEGRSSVSPLSAQVSTTHPAG